MKDRELSQSKESLDSSMGSDMKRTSSKESVKGKEGPAGFTKVIQGPTKEVTASVGSVGGVSLQDLNKENRERSAPSKDTQSCAKGSIENMQAPLFQQVTRICTIMGMHGLQHV